MAMEIVDFPIENGGSFYSYVRLPVHRVNVTEHRPEKIPGEAPWTDLLAEHFFWRFRGDFEYMTRPKFHIYQLYGVFLGHFSRGEDDDEPLDSGQLSGGSLQIMR